MLKIGHRGARGYKPENSLSSFKHAIKLNVDMIELDVQLTKDNIPLVIHDSKINRTTNGKGKVKNYTLKELKKYNIKYKRKIIKEKIPTLEEVLKLKTKFNIEIKNSKASIIIAKLISKLKLEKKVIISSSSSKILKEIKQINKKIFTGLIIYSGNKINSSMIMSIYKLMPKTYLIYKTKKIDAEYIHPNIGLINNTFIKKIKKAGLKINVWTVNNKKVIKKLKKLNVDGIISDYPDRL